MACILIKLFTFFALFPHFSQPRANPGVIQTPLRSPSQTNQDRLSRRGPGLGLGFLGSTSGLSGKISPASNNGRVKTNPPPLQIPWTQHPKQPQQFTHTQQGAFNQPYRTSRTSAQPYPTNQFSSIPATAPCGGTVFVQDPVAPQSIVSPGYPAQYPNGSYCEWRIMTNAGGQLRINATDFALESSETCKSDYVQFFWASGSSSSWTVNKHQVDRFCGSNGPVDLVFKDTNLSNRGFNISFTAFSTCAALYELPDFQGIPTILEEFYESTIWPSHQSDKTFSSVEITPGCKLMMCNEEQFEGTCHLFFMTNRYFVPLHVNWPKAASCVCT